MWPHMGQTGLVLTHGCGQVPVSGLFLFQGPLQSYRDQQEPVQRTHVQDYYQETTLAAAMKLLDRVELIN